MKRNNREIWKLNLKRRVEAGIDVNPIPGLFPEFYERSACNAANYQFDTSWQELTLQQKADHIAHYILGMLIQSHAEEAQADQMEREQRKKGKK